MKLEAKSPVGDGFMVPDNVAYKPLVGTDPEVFAFVGNKLLPAFEFLPAKDKPLMFTLYPTDSSTDSPLTKAYATYSFWDGFQAEFNIGQPFTCLLWQARMIRQGLESIYKAATKFDSKARLTLRSTVRVSEDVLKSVADPFVELGCTPSLNAYGLVGTEVANPRALKYRFAGGHMHFGIPSLHKNPLPTVKMMDAIVGLWSVGAAKSFDDPIRRQYYGLPGEYRLPKHGLEYRTLSNFWLSHPIVFNMTWELARKAVQLSLTQYAKLWVAPEEMVTKALLNNDTKIAKKLLELNKPIFKWLFAMRGWDDRAITRMFNVGLDGIESVVDDPEAITDNWMITKNPEDIQPGAERNRRYTWFGYSSEVYPNKAL